MTEKKTTDSRRKALKSIAAGTGAVVAGKSLPESWSKPVVDTVMLPTHASTTSESGADGCAQLSIPAASLDCIDGDSLIQFRAYVDDTGECPVLVERGGEQEAPSPAEIVVSRVDSSGGDIYGSFGAIDGETKPERIAKFCFEDNQDPGVEPINIGFTALSGAKWNASGTLTRTEIGVSVGKVTLSPV